MPVFLGLGDVLAEALPDEVHEEPGRIVAVKGSVLIINNELPGG